MITQRRLDVPVLADMIERLLGKNGRSCGEFTQDQLNSYTHIKGVKQAPNMEMGAQYELQLCTMSTI
jgi:hypothetical protein